MAEEHRLRRRAAPRPQRQAAQAPPPRPLLAGPHNLDLGPGTLRPGAGSPTHLPFPLHRRFGRVAAHAAARPPQLMAMCSATGAARRPERARSQDSTAPPAAVTATPAATPVTACCRSLARPLTRSAPA